MKCLPTFLPKSLLTLATLMACFAAPAFANESTTWAPNPVDWSGNDVRWRGRTVQGANEKAFDSMAGVGAKPSKAELAKRQQAAAGAQAATARAPLAETDRRFLQSAVNDGMMQVHLGEMARKQGRSPEVKQVGTRIVTDRAKVTNRLMGIAYQNGFKPALRPGQNTMSKKDLKNFDQALLGMLVNNHQKDVAAFERQAKLGSDPVLKGYVRQALPVLQGHLRLAQAAQKEVGKMSAASASSSIATAQAQR